MENPEHRRAWEILQKIPEGQKNLFLVRAVLHEQDREYLKQVVQKAVREELKGCRIGGSVGDGEINRMPESGFGFYFHAAGGIKIRLRKGICK